MSLYAPESSLLTIKYYPENEALLENPPRFTWMPAGGDNLKYAVEICADEGFEKDVILRENIPYNFYTLDTTLKSGEYFWRYKTMCKPGDYSKIRSFTVADGLPETPLPGREIRFASADKSHPRLWMNGRQIEEFKKRLKDDPTYCGFDAFYKNSVEPRAAAGFPKEPLPYPDNKRVIPLWRGNYMQCQEAMCYIRSLSVAGVILDHAGLVVKAKSALLEIAKWDVNGPTSRNYNDECAFRVVYALAFGYDWLYAHLSADERESVMESLFARTKQVAEHIIVDSRVHYSLYDSHAIRSLPMVITPCCIAMLFERDEAADWLNYAIDYLSAIYTPWGGQDGGWAEGALYWTTGMAFLTDGVNAIKNYLKIDFYKRPFLQSTGAFPLHCHPVETYRASFGDQSSLGEPSVVKTGFNMRQFGAVSGNGDYIWHFNRTMERCVMNPPDFANKGWWDLYYDDMQFRHDYGTPEEKKPDRGVTAKWFKDVGWAAVNKNMADFENHIFLLTKSSPYGSVSHSHGDQNSFVLFAFGEPLIAETGYYIGFNSSMHRDWRKQTHSHNCITIDGKGQYSEMDKSKQLSAKGKILDVKQKGDYVYIAEDATQAYAENVDYLESFIREIHFVDGEYFVIVDSVKLSREGQVNFRLHSLNPFNISENGFHIKGGKAQLKGRFIYCSGGIDSVTETDEFEGVNPDEIAGLDKHFHLTMNTKSAKSHVIITVLHPLKNGEEKYISAIKDDQGMDMYFYIDNNGKTFTLRLEGDKRY